ncbi:hypothetical protein [Microcoleus sp. B4-C1]|uniref:hypothetical protein n=2 Tax=unclassified Microcoleus TaxID=2642155 RepID=UPI002FD4357F
MQAGKLRKKAGMSDSKQCFCDHNLALKQQGLCVLAIKLMQAAKQLHQSVLTPMQYDRACPCKRISINFYRRTYEKQVWAVAIAMLGDIFIQMRGKLQPSE